MNDIPTLTAQHSDNHQVDQLIHKLLNQLTVINLCTFSLGAHSAPATKFAAELRRINHAVNCAAELAEAVRSESATPSDDDNPQGREIVQTPQRSKAKLVRLQVRTNRRPGKEILYHGKIPRPDNIRGV